jgi:TatD DNase family protein
VAELLALADDDNIIAIGETGLDYFHVEKDMADWQRERFRRHIAASNQSTALFWQPHANPPHF